MKIHVILVSLAVVLLALGCTGDRRRGSSGSRGGDPSGATQPRPGAGTPICSNSCESAENGICEDGATGSMSERCERGTDCADCGTRYDSSSSGSGGDEDAGPSPVPSGCECDYYEGECECECDPDCDFGSSDGGTSGLLGFGDECECFSEPMGGAGFCSSECDAELLCFSYEGSWGFCSMPCSYLDVGLYEVCPRGGQCQEVLVADEYVYLCMPT